MNDMIVAADVKLSEIKSSEKEDACENEIYVVNTFQFVTSTTKVIQLCNNLSMRNFLFHALYSVRVSTRQVFINIQKMK